MPYTGVSKCFEVGGQLWKSRRLWGRRPLDSRGVWVRKFWNLVARRCHFQRSNIYFRGKLWCINSSIIVLITLIQIDLQLQVALIFMKSSQGRNADLRTLAYPTLQSIAWKWKKYFHHICMRWKCSSKKSFMVFQNSRFFCRNFMLQVNCMQTAYSNGPLPNKFWIWLLVTVKIFKVIVNVRVI